MLIQPIALTLILPDISRLLPRVLSAHKHPSGEISGSNPLPEAVTSSEGISSFLTGLLCTRKLSILEVAHLLNNPDWKDLYCFHRCPQHYNLLQMACSRNIYRCEILTFQFVTHHFTIYCLLFLLLLFRGACAIPQISKVYIHKRTEYKPMSVLKQEKYVVS